METVFKSQKLEWCKDELRTLLKRLNEGNYQQTAEIVFDHVAHTGVETDVDPSLKQEPTFADFMKSE